MNKTVKLKKSLFFSKSSQKNAKRYIISSVKILCIVICVYYFLNILFLDNFSIISYFAKKDNLNKLQASHENISRQNKQLEIEIEKLKKDPNYIESIARKNYTMVKTGELIYIFRK